MVPIRGTPYQGSYSAKGNANANNLTGPAMIKHVADELGEMAKFIQDTSAGASLKDKNTQDVKVLIGV